MTVLDDGLPPADDELDYENTYIMTPEGYGPNQRFESAKVKLVIEDILKEALDNGLEYDPSKAGQKAKELCEQVKEQVKQLGYSRYKLIVEGTICEKRGQAVRSNCLCLWNPKTDKFASAHVETANMFCVFQVYGMYYE